MIITIIIIVIIVVIIIMVIIIMKTVITITMIIYTLQTSINKLDQHFKQDKRNTYSKNFHKTRKREEGKERRGKN